MGRGGSATHALLIALRDALLSPLSFTENPNGVLAFSRR
jgi:hypothetical protein